MPGYDDKTIDKNISEHNEIYKSGVTPTRKDIKWTGAERRQRDKDMKQFCKSSGESGTDPYFTVSDAYRVGWDRIFGDKPGRLLKTPMVFGGKLDIAWGPQSEEEFLKNHPELEDDGT